MKEKDLKRKQKENKEVLENEKDKDPVVETETSLEEEAAKAAAMEAEAGEDFSDENPEEKPDKKDLAIADLTDRLKRSMAEFENFRKRNEKEKATMFDMGARSMAEKLLPVVDNFERAMLAAPADGEGKAFAEGITMIYNQMTKTLEDLGVKAIDCVGKEFDPNFHNAVMHIEDENLGENVVAEELLKGYMYKDTVLRHSMVKVAN
ncbi:nucleotide exchange factor GrpE [Lachnoanaerobaculum sp. Marseille-Q4761]|uniref:nucleotide exchange factor GrpE n=1 Tax=Lachnoanaerobaculum sp. Marseille-Q4761 TaxID=2819511 RepID=UPI000F15B1F9|nr:nucleotide exchange factor GrpE [Lachnoanaerobaculum sp. Marseille-Q4761]RKW49002.1 MAG: nucleotide exchange factor GrpE [Lachnospiraceae bacterium]